MGAFITSVEFMLASCAYVVMSVCEGVNENE